MSEKDPLKIKLDHLCNYWRELKRPSRMSLSEYLDDGVVRAFVERKIHLAIECCLDIASYLITEKHYRIPTSNRDMFDVLLENKIISNSLARRMGQLAAMRNILVHDYAAIDNRKVFSVLKHHLSDFEEFGKAMKKFLE